VSRSSSLIAAVLLILWISAGVSQNAQNNARAPNLMRWREDLAFYREQMPKKHGNLFHTMTREQFNASVDALENMLPGLTENQVKTEIMRLVAQVCDGHTRLRQETMGNHMLPVRLHYFSDGLFVEAGDKRVANIVGGNVLRIGTMSADSAYSAVRPLIPVDNDNEYRRRLLAPALLVTPEVLQAIGASTRDDVVDLTVQKEGKTISAELPAGPFRPWNNHGWPTDPEGWINARDAAKDPTPLWLQHTDKNYWHTYLTGENTLYVQYNEVHDQPGGEPISEYFPRIFQEAEQRNVQRVVLDIRLNGGGNNQLNRPIWHAIIKSERLNQKGKLWVLIGPKTFSAAMDFVDDVEMNTNVLFAGEPTGESPNQWGDPVDLTLPNSGIVIQAATLWWQLQDPRDRRECRAPDLSVPLTFSDYANNVDPVMKTILRDGNRVPSEQSRSCDGDHQGDPPKKAE
jgi:hypothetical protein